MIKQSYDSVEISSLKKMDGIEIDERFHFIKQVFVWLSLERSSRKVLAFEVGSRGKKALKRLIVKLSRKFKVKKYSSDHYPVYKSVITEDGLVVGKGSQL